MPKVAIVGITSWGITIGLVLASKGTKVSILTRTEQESSNLQKGGLSSGRFPINQIPANLTFTHDTAEAMKKINAVVLPVPSQTMRTNIQSIKSYLNDNTLIISAAKGLEIGTRKRMSQVIAEEIEARFRRNICVMSGPNLAREIVQGLPAATVAAAEDKEITGKSNAC
jgi:glycerol-3-phosphate dehydrogenase (NAD(P)+)